ncbi:hypothetical protein F443_11027 [Phytophthora nicotianae P1569]|uniref:Uncharacterized protein n=1 Tax=Phytophthora nicotianae P1569 TaxID=1317065 RepID=V9EYC6_PHYNI|nr:hypothetical protein F443_11027 [Phytophthora nicotianae P1569]
MPRTASSRAAHDANVPEKSVQVTLKVVPEAIGTSPNAPEAGSRRDLVQPSNCTPETVSEAESESACRPGERHEDGEAMAGHKCRRIGRCTACTDPDGRLSAEGRGMPERE